METRRTPKHRVIAFLGRKGSGKTTAARWVSDHYGARIFSFANGLKTLAARTFPETPSCAWFGTQEEKQLPRPSLGGRSGRAILQNLGVAARDVLGPDVWVDRLMRCLATWQIQTIDDMRFPNEARLINALSEEFGPLVIKLTGDWVGTEDTHPSESSVDLVPKELIYTTIHHQWSDQGPEDLFRQLHRVLHPLLSR